MRNIGGWLLLGLSLASVGCATVRPEQRSILADRPMRFDDLATERAARDHVFVNREGSVGGGAVEGGGCGCN